MKSEMTPYYFRAIPFDFGGWVVELFDKDLRAMGIASKDGKAVVSESRGGANREAKKRGLSPFPGVSHEH